MAKKKSGEGSNVILVVALVFFVLTTIALGVWAWTGQEQIAKSKGDADAATKKLSDETKEKDIALAKNQLYRTMIGIATPEERSKVIDPAPAIEPAIRAEHKLLLDGFNQKTAALFSSKADADDPAAKSIRTAEDIQKLEKLGYPLKVAANELFIWPWAEGKKLDADPPLGALNERMVRLVAERERTYWESVAQRKNADDEGKAYKKAKDEYTQFLADASAKVQEQIKSLDAAIKKVEEDKIAAIKLFEGASDTYRKDVAKRANELDETKNQLTEARNLSQKLNQTLTDKLARDNEIEESKKGAFAVNLPHGEILKRKDLGDNSATVEINLGSADGLKPGQTFNIQPASTKLTGLPPRGNGNSVSSKGEIEIVSILDAHLATARITKEPEQIRDGILKGDLLYNPLFKKGAQDHVVLAGIFDTEGSGIDDIAQVAQRLQKRGVIVDGFFDLATDKWESPDPKNKKPGPSQSTTYVIRGWMPDAGSNDGLGAEKSALITKINNAIQEAKLKGAQEVRALRFFPELGYPISNNINDNSINTAAIKYLSVSTPKPAAPKEGK